ncbi:MAG: hypothetical protein ACXU9O_15225 [Gemmatimonadaceae bacterium]
MRFKIVDRPSESIQPTSRSCEGTVFGTVADTILIKPEYGCLKENSARTEISEVHIEGKNRGSRLQHFVYAALIGAIAGGVIGRLVAGDGCTMPICDDGEFAIGVITTAGVAVGATAGGAVGLALPAGRQWQHLSGIASLVTSNGVPILHF